MITTTTNTMDYYPKRFALLGAAGYIAPRHMQAINDIGGNLIAAMDPCDNVGILDRYDPSCAFFTRFERLDRHLLKLQRQHKGIDWLSVCTPNWLHDVHCIAGLRWGANVVVEKPLVISPWNLGELKDSEVRYGRRIYTIMQLRQHEVIKKIRQNLQGRFKPSTVRMRYIAPRGPWFQQSWKGKEDESGGLIYSIGIHALDSLLMLFGMPCAYEVYRRDNYAVDACLVLEQANVELYLSIDPQDLPTLAKNRPYRVIEVDGQMYDLTSGFENLHTEAYREIMQGRGIGINDVWPSIELAHRLRHAAVHSREKLRIERKIEHKIDRRSTINTDQKGAELCLPFSQMTKCQPSKSTFSDGPGSSL